MPYVFAHHFSGEGTAAALDLYRRSFRPSDISTHPVTFLTVNVAVAPTQAEAERLVRPQLLAMVALRTGGDLKPQLSVEEAERTELSEGHRGLAAQMRSRWVVGTPESALTELSQLAATYHVDEIMIHPVAGASELDPRRESPARERTIAALANQLGAVARTA